MTIRSGRFLCCQKVDVSDEQKEKKRGLRVVQIVALMPHGSNGNNDEGRLMAKTVRIQMSGT